MERLGYLRVAASRVDVSKLPAGAERPYEFMARCHLAPLSPDGQVKQEAAELKRVMNDQ